MANGPHPHRLDTPPQTVDSLLRQAMETHRGQVAMLGRRLAVAEQLLRNHHTTLAHIMAYGQEPTDLDADWLEDLNPERLLEVRLQFELAREPDPV